MFEPSFQLVHTVLMYEGAPDCPQPDRWWSIIEQYGVSVFYTAPTAIRYSMKLGEEWPKKHDLSSLRLLGTVGEPINPEAWKWYYANIGNERCSIVDTWWQTETGMILIIFARRNKDKAKLGNSAFPRSSSRHTR